jgi:hypothetical protein
MCQTTAQSIEVYRMVTEGLCQGINDTMTQTQQLTLQLSLVEQYMQVEQISQQV